MDAGNEDHVTGRHASIGAGARSRAALRGLGAVVPLCAVLWSAAVASADYIHGLVELTGQVTTVLIPLETFGHGGELKEDGHLSSRGVVRYSVRVRNRTGDPIDASSLVVIVEQIPDHTHRHNLLAHVDIPGADGQTPEGKPYFLIPGGKHAVLEPYRGESVAFQLEIRNPDLRRLAPPVLRVRGLHQTLDRAVRHAFQALVDEGILTEEELPERLRQPPP